MGEVSIPAHLRVFVEALGEDGAVDFLLAFGGSELLLGSRPMANNPVRQALGDEAARALAAVSHRLPREIPLGKRWLVQVLTARGLSQGEIARRLHIGVRSVRRHQKGEHDPNRLASRLPNQLSLFD